MSRILRNRGFIQAVKNANVAIHGFGGIGKAVAETLVNSLPREIPLNLFLLTRSGQESINRLAGFSRDLEQYIAQSDLHNIHITSGSDETHGHLLSAADAIVLAGGVSASKTGVKSGKNSRYDLLPLNYHVMMYYAGLIKKHGVKPDTLVLPIANPIELTTWILQQETGLKNIVGCGTELDAARFKILLRQILKENNRPVPEAISASVIGAHSGDHMIVPFDSIRFDDMPIDSDDRELMGFIDLAKKGMQEEGYKILKLNNQSAALGPAGTIVNGILIPYITGSRDRLIKTTAAIAIKNPEEYHGIEDAPLSLPLRIHSQRSNRYPAVTIDKNSGFILQSAELAKLNEIADDHKRILTELSKNLTNSLEQIRVQQDFLKAQEIKAFDLFKKLNSGFRALLHGAEKIIAKKPDDFFIIIKGNNLDTKIKLALTNENRETHEEQEAYLEAMKNILLSKGMAENDITIKNSLQEGSLSIEANAKNKRIIENLFPKQNLKEQNNDLQQK